MPIVERPTPTGLDVYGRPGPVALLLKLLPSRTVGALARAGVKSAAHELCERTGRSCVDCRQSTAAFDRTRGGLSRAEFLAEQRERLARADIDSATRADLLRPDTPEEC